MIHKFYGLFSKILSGLLWAMTGITGMGLLMGVLSFGLWPFETANYWIPAYLLVGFVAGVCSLAIRHYLRGVMGITSALVCLAMMVGHWLPVLMREDPVHEPNLRVLTANVYYQGNNPEPLLTLIEDTKPDIVLLQEVDEKWRTLLAPLERKYENSAFCPRYEGGKLDLAQFWNGTGETPKELCTEGMPATSFTVGMNGQKMTVMNVHTASPFSPKRADNYQKQMHLLTQYAAECEGTLVMAGDFNSGLWSWHYKRLIEASALHNVRDGFGLQGTWPSFTGPLRIALDHILVTPDIEVIRCWTVCGIGSDHIALFADIYF